MTGALHEGQYTFLIISHSILLRMGNISGKNCREPQTHILCSITFFPKIVSFIIWKNILERGIPQMTVWRKRIACWEPKAKSTHLEYVILITLLLQQWFHERTSILRCTYIVF